MLPGVGTRLSFYVEINALLDLATDNIHTTKVKQDRYGLKLFPVAFSKNCRFSRFIFWPHGGQPLRPLKSPGY